jgi:hypothetical protein
MDMLVVMALQIVLLDHQSIMLEVAVVAAALACQVEDQED